MPFLFRILIFSAFLLAIDFYAFQGVKLLTESLPTTARKVIHGLFWLIPFITIGFFIYMSTLEGRPNGSLPRIVGAVIMLLYMSKVFFLLFLFMDDIRRLVQVGIAQLRPEPVSRVSRSKFLTTFGILTAGAPLALLTYGMLRNKYRYRVARVDVPIPDLDPRLEGFKIVQISDVHAGSFGKADPLQKGIEMINELEGDIVLFTGDLVNSIASEMTPYIDTFKQIQGKYGVFSVLGNHDYGDYHRFETKEDERQNFDDFLDVHKKLGWDLLRNESRQIFHNGANLNLVGVENTSAASHFRSAGDLKLAVEGVESGTTVLMSHDPSHWDAEVNKDFPEIDLTLSGHTHGMQFGFRSKLIKWSPVQYAYKQWVGLYRKGKQYIYVNPGFGFIGYHGRVGILPEITLLTLRKGDYTG